MNKFNKLKTDLDDVFGFDENQKSSFKKIKQYYDQSTNEHVTIIEYRTKRDGEIQVDKGALRQQRNEFQMMRKLLASSDVK